MNDLVHGARDAGQSSPLPRLIRAALEDYANRLRQRFGGRLRLVRLYGSWARGEAHVYSDIDVAAVIEGLTVDEWRFAVGESGSRGWPPTSS